MNPELGPDSPLQDWLDWQETQHPTAIDLGLDRVWQVAAHLNLLNPRARVITIAGTNGKGSCVASLETLLSAAGQRFGAYTSPHFLRYNERVRLQQTPVSDAQLSQAFARIDAARGEISLTYFEWGTLAAMLIFNDQSLDYWLLEVGLGGRLDAVNIIEPNVAVITSIALDHQAWLGDTREQIGYEKAGICRAGVPLICADTEVPASIRQRVGELACPSRWWGEDFGVDVQGNWAEFRLSNGQSFCVQHLHLPEPSIAAALEVAIAEGFLPPIDQLPACLQAAQLTGRLQAITLAGVPALLDVAHNPAAAERLANTLKARGYKALRVVVAVMADKDLAGVLAPLVPLVAEWHCAALPGNSRAATPEQLAAVLAQVQSLNLSPAFADSGLTVPVQHRVMCHDSVKEALEAGRAACLADPTISAEPLLVFGSFYTVAEALTYHPATESGS